jgi:uncharacterized tellurite resistance protein B-like protein
MFEKLKSLFCAEGGGAGGNDEEALLAVAVLMAEAAATDGTIDGKERERMTLLMRQRFGLSQEAAQRWIEQAIAQDDRATQLYPFAKLITDRFDAARRIELMEMLWEVTYSDGRLHDYEASLMRRLAGLLFVSDHDSGVARQQAMARIGVADDPLA